MAIGVVTPFQTVDLSKADRRPVTGDTPFEIDSVTPVPAPRRPLS
jgi:hypothetical protein